MSVQLKEAGVKTTDLQHLLDKASKQQQELQTQQQNTTSKLREAQVSSSQVHGVFTCVNTMSHISGNDLQPLQDAFSIYS